jgi:hypothetical protein
MGEHDLGLVDIGVGGILALLILRFVFEFISKRRNGTDKIDFRKMAHNVVYIRDIISKTDSEGVPLCYVRRSLETAIDKLAENIKLQGDLFKELVHAVKTLSDGVHRSSEAFRKEHRPNNPQPPP